MNFKDAVDWLYSFQKFGMKLGLERIVYISDKLDNPQKKYKIVHVAGTNGKGSVCKFLESVLVENNYTVGVYTSPHLQRITERVTVNNKEIPEEELVSIIEKVKPIVEEMVNENNNPTFFEVFTAVAFEYFKDKKVDFALIEVGLGGRFDATNIVDPVVSVITNVTLEHQDVLGDTVEKIAFEKAGIIKNNAPVVTAAKGKAVKVIEEIAGEKNTEILRITDSSWKKIKNIDSRHEFRINSFLDAYSVNTSLYGKHQGENIALAVSVVELLNKNGFKVSKKSIIKGVEKTLYPGRMEIVSYNPNILLDGAHNIAGMNALSYSLENDFDFEKLIIVLGILSDKNIEEMLPAIVSLADIIIVTRSNNSRACDPVKLKDMVVRSGFKKKVIVEDQIKNAIDYAKNISTENDMICVTGSLFTVGEARNIFVL